jgi:hypothetical protein
MKRHMTLLIVAALAGMLTGVVGDRGPRAQAAVSTGDRTTILPQSDSRTGPRLESSVTGGGYTLVLQQFTAPLVSPAVQRTLATHDTVLQFRLSWRHGARRLSGLLHAFRHGTQLHLAVQQKVYLTDLVDGAVRGRRLVPVHLDGTVTGVRADVQGFLRGTRAAVTVEATLPGDAFGARITVQGLLSLRRISH